MAVDGRTVLSIAGLDPEPLGVDDVQYTSTLNLADTPNGRRLVQVEAHHEAEGVERVQARIVEFDAASWGSDALDPYYVVTATVGRDRSITLPAVRFVCRADVSAFEGTRRSGAMGGRAWSGTMGHADRAVLPTDLARPSSRFRWARGQLRAGDPETARADS